MSDETGMFHLEDIRSGNWILKFSYLGYEEHSQSISVSSSDDIIDLGTVILKENAVALSEVTVIANRLRVYSKGGRIVTDIANSSLKDIGSAKEVMKHIPGVMVTKDKYEVFGKGGSVIYINNKKMRNDNELLMLKSKDILRVEVISNPGVGYDADTRAVVKITTRKRRSDGLMAQVDAEGTESNHFSHNEGISLNYQWGKLNLFGSYRFDHTREDIKYDVSQTAKEKEVEYREVSSSRYTDSSYDHSYAVGMNYDFSDKHSVGIQYTGYDRHVKTCSGFEKDWIKMYENSSLFADNGNALLGKDDTRFENVSLYYYLKPVERLSLQVDAEYAHDKLSGHERVEEISYLDNRSETTNTYSENNSRVYAVKGVFDYLFNNRHGLKWGVDYSVVKIDGHSRTPEGKIDDDVYDNREHKYAAFIQYRINSGRVQGEAGLRYEFVRSETTDFGEVIGKKEYSDILPSFSLSFPLQKVDFSLNFTNRLQRPSFDQLNNRVKYNNQFHQEKGNPNLAPQKIYDVDLNVKYFVVNLRLNYQYVKDYIYTTAEQSEVADGSSVWFTTNAPKYQQIGAMLVVSPSWGCWTPTLSAGIYKQYLTLDYLGKPLDYNKPYGLLSFQNEFSLPRKFIVRADLQWNTKGNRGIYYMKGFGYSELSVQKSFFSDNLNVTLRGEDLFNWSKTKDTKILNYLVSNRATDSYGRRIVVSVSWNFNNFKTKYKGTGAGSDEINRL